MSDGPELHPFWYQPFRAIPRGGNYTHASASKDEGGEWGYHFSRCYHPTIEDAVKCISKHKGVTIKPTAEKFPVSENLREMTIHAVFDETSIDNGKTYNYVTAIYNWTDEEPYQ